MAEPLDLLRALFDTRVPFALYGTSGLALVHPSVRRALPDSDRDLDIVLDPDLANVRAVAAFAASKGAVVTCWGEPFDPAWSDDALAGKYYIRCVFSAPEWNTQLDATYECDWFDAREAIGRATLIDGVPVLAEEDLWFSKLTKSELGGREFAARYGLEIPSTALARLAAARPRYS
ncbi:MAG: hypothetical protein JNK05_15110 [Myxococcales bacterium]|nr:hypothetical protein [Myxococcales bacterium]